MRWRESALTLGALALVAGPTNAQSVSNESAPPDTVMPSGSPFGRMQTLLEKTIFKVDVLTLEVRVGDEDARRVESLVRGREYSRGVADAVAEVATHSQDAWARIEFVRDVSLDQFLDGVDDNLRRARDAGLLNRDEYAMISAGLPRWFGFLRERRILEGDRIFYRIHGDTLRTQYWSVGGERLLDQTDVGRARRLAVLGSYFVRKSDFREGLIRSLFDR